MANLKTKVASAVSALIMAGSMAAAIVPGVGANVLANDVITAEACSSARSSTSVGTKFGNVTYKGVHWAGWELYGKAGTRTEIQNLYNKGYVIVEFKGTPGSTFTLRDSLTFNIIRQGSKAYATFNSKGVGYAVVPLRKVTNSNTPDVSFIIYCEKHSSGRRGDVDVKAYMP